MTKKVIEDIYNSINDELAFKIWRFSLKRALELLIKNGDLRDEAFNDYVKEKLKQKE